MVFEHQELGAFLEAREATSTQFAAAGTKERPITFEEALVIQAASDILLGGESFYGKQISELTGFTSGTIYPTLRRLERAYGMVTSHIETLEEVLAHDGNQPRKVYVPTEFGTEIFKLFQPEDVLAMEPVDAASIGRTDKEAFYDAVAAVLGHSYTLIISDIRQIALAYGLNETQGAKLLSNNNYYAEKQLAARGVRIAVTHRKARIIYYDGSVETDANDLAKSKELIDQGVEAANAKSRNTRLRRAQSQ